MPQQELPRFPAFAPIDLVFQDEVSCALAGETCGVSEYTFAGLYLFRRRYDYRVCADEAGNLIVSGAHDGKKFFMTPVHAPSGAVLSSLFETHDYWKAISQVVFDEFSARDDKNSVEITEDRDNFDYLYLRSELAALSGKRFHKKKNLVNAFCLAYPDHAEFPLTPDRVPDALRILEHWKAEKKDEGDYAAARESLELIEQLKFSGLIMYIKNEPAAYCLGEGLANGTTYALHFEKGVDGYKGVYQAINNFFAAVLESRWEFLNREQDLGEEGMRQAKMTYRPVGFVKKYVGFCN